MEEREERVREEQHGNTKFYLKDAFRYVVDDVDEYLGTVELSHHEDLGYSEVVNFELPEDESILDFTWMKKGDILSLENNDKYPIISEVKINIDNMSYSSFPSSSEEKMHFFLTVNKDNTKTSLAKKIKSFKYFVKRYAPSIMGIRLEGFSRVEEMLLTKNISNYKVKVYPEETQEQLKR